MKSGRLQVDLFDYWDQVFAGKHRVVLLPVSTPADSFLRWTARQHRLSSAPARGLVNKTFFSWCVFSKKPKFFGHGAHFKGAKAAGDYTKPSFQDEKGALI